MYLYLFVVHKYVIGNVSGIGKHIHTSYPVETPEPMTATDLDIYASTLAFAERYAMNNTIYFPLVSALEVDPEKPFSAQTITRQMCIRNVNQDAYNYKTRGLLFVEMRDWHTGVTVKLDRETGRSKQRFLPGVVAMRDVATARYNPKLSNRLVLNPDGVFARLCWPWVARAFNSLPGLFTRFNINDDGEIKEQPPIASWHKLGAIVNGVRARRNWTYQPLSEFWAQHVVGDALVQATNFIRIYFNANQAYSHKWGNGELMTLPQFTFLNPHCITLWHDLAVAIGYTFPARFATIYKVPRRTELQTTTPAPGTLSIDDPDGRVLEVINQLFQCWLWFENYKYRRDNMGEQYRAALAAGYNETLQGSWSARWNYDNYDAYMYVSFKLLDLLCVLKMILKVKGALRPRRLAVRPKEHQLYPKYQVPEGSNLPWEMQFFQVMWAHPKDPFIYNPPKNEVTVTLPEPDYTPITTPTPPAPPPPTGAPPTPATTPRPPRPDEYDDLERFRARCATAERKLRNQPAVNPDGTFYQSPDSLQPGGGT